MELVGGEFTECVVAYRDVWLPAGNIVHKAIEKRQEVCTSCPNILTTVIFADITRKYVLSAHNVLSAHPLL